MIASKFDHVVRLKVFTKGEWVAHNRCRLFLKLLLVANVDICNGFTVDINFWKGNTQSERSRDIYWSCHEKQDSHFVTDI